jgi:pimeloyl-ACP methyl ester carboxylesterase
MPDAAYFLTLASGHRLAWNEYGAPDGEPVFFCPGWPGSRRQAARLDAAAKQFGFRLLALDRPGIALSDRPATRALRDWPALLEEVCALLDVARFRIVGVSGGGPYALISAWKFPDRVLAAATVCGAPPIAEMNDRSQLSPVYRKLLTLYESQPGSVRWLFRVMRPFVRLPFPRPIRPFILKMLGGADAETLSDPEIFEICHGTFRRRRLR